MANVQSWDDFNLIKTKLNFIKTGMRTIVQEIADLQEDKINILDDPTRKAELKKIVDIHPNYSITSLTNEYNTLIALKTWWETNG